MNNNNPLIEKADKVAFLVYKLTRNFPKEEIYGMTSQLRRAALSIPLNIIEGFARKGSRDCRQFLYIAYGSFKETKYLLYFAHREKFFSQKEYKEILFLAEEVGKMLWTSIKTINKKIDK
ncbi:four helix bundle protein [Dehalococcoidia bacterium]|nr:four helix bundle protein [Dehalococcoidia bacterium]